jgi:hypothetical protein
LAALLIRRLVRRLQVGKSGTVVDQRTPADDALGQGTETAQPWLPWLLRLAWIATGVAGSSAVTDAVAPRSTGVELVATWGAAAGWVVGVAAMAVPATLSLTATRVVVPLAVVAAVAAWVGGASVGAGAVFLGLSAAATAVALSGDLGRAFVQASAYGNEERFPLRPPVGFAVAAVLAWILWSTGLVAGALLTGARVWLAGIPLVVLAAAGAVVLGRRWHLLSRRWLVFVPAGLVLHDRVVLGETLMLRRSQLDRLRLAPADTEALDLTGPASGHAIEMTVREMVTVLLPPTTEHPNGRAVHVRAFLAGPTRPGSALAAARRRRFPVG